MSRFLRIVFAAFLLTAAFAFAVCAAPTVAFGDNSTNCMLYGQTYELYLTETDPSVPVYFTGTPKSRIQIVNDNQVVLLAPGSCMITAHNAQSGKNLATRQFFIKKRAESLNVSFTETILYPGESAALEVTQTPSDATDTISFIPTVFLTNPDSANKIVDINRNTENVVILEAKKAGTEIVKAVAKYDAETRDDNPENVYTYVTVHVHEHVWSEEWAIDGDYHYHECVAEYCKITDNSEKKSYNMHTYTNDGFCICGRPCEVLDRDGVRRKVVLYGGSAVYERTDNEY